MERPSWKGLLQSSREHSPCLLGGQALGWATHTIPGREPPFGQSGRRADDGAGELAQVDVRDTDERLAAGTTGAAAGHAAAAGRGGAGIGAAWAAIAVGARHFPTSVKPLLPGPPLPAPPAPPGTATVLPSPRSPGVPPPSEPSSISKRQGKVPLPAGRVRALSCAADLGVVENAFDATSRGKRFPSWSTRSAREHSRATRASMPEQGRSPIFG